MCFKTFLSTPMDMSWLIAGEYAVEACQVDAGLGHQGRQPACPVAQTFPGMVESAIREVEGVTAAQVELVWGPPWCADNLSMEVKLQLGLL